MQRTVEYRSFEIHVDLMSTSKDMFNVWFRIEGPTALNCTPKVGHRSNLWGVFHGEHSEQLKLKVVKQYLGGGGGMRVLAERHGVGCSVLRRWIAAYEQHGRDGLRKKFSRYDVRYKMSVLTHMWREELSRQQARISSAMECVRVSRRCRASRA
jgi:transposase-like protein